MTTYGAELYETRAEMGLSSRKFARLAGVSHVHILDIERGAATPSAAVAARIAEAVAQHHGDVSAQKLRGARARETSGRDEVIQAQKGFGSGLRAWRTCQRVSLRKLAAAASMSHVYVGEIERGLAYPSKAMATRMLLAVEQLSTAEAASRIRELYTAQPHEARRRRLADAVDRARDRGVISCEACATIHAILMGDML